MDINNNESVATCEYCGTQQTLPRLDDDKRANMYDRANHFRRNNEFDKAMGIYEQILNEDNTDAEAYWSLVLCRYGIEYVEDPSSHKRTPTVNRAQFTSVFDDEDYKSAIKYADGYQRNIYEEEARAINEIQKGILAISQKEEPFDVFICYKETDNNGRRTPDSVLAQELYFQLQEEGFKVFFSRITLEDKLGSAYEPYIFAALNSAKVMVVIGTKQEYFNAVWVKNEWSRYLALIKQGQKKMLIPAYRDMDPYDLPEEFSHLQAQDMTKLGFMQDLIRGIKKIAQTDTPKEKTIVKETVATSANTNTAPLLKRAFMFLEDGDWQNADEYCEKVLDLDPECAEAYLGKLMVELNVKKKEDLENLPLPFNDRNSYQKVIRFADDELKIMLINCIQHINLRNENERLERIYSKAVAAMKAAKTEHDFRMIADSFESISEYKDSAALATRCNEYAEATRKDAIYSQATCFAKNGRVSRNEKAPTIKDLKNAINLLELIKDWKDSEELILLYQRTIEEIEAKNEAERIAAERRAQIARREAEIRAKRNKKIAIIATPIVCAVIAFVFLLNNVIIPTVKYNSAVSLMSERKYTEAISTFKALEGYKDSEFKIGDCERAILDEKYNDAIALIEDGNYDEAYRAFINLGTYKDSKIQLVNIRSQKSKDSLKNCNVGDYIKFGAYEQDNNLDNGKEDIEWLVLEIKDGKALVISKLALDCVKYNSTKNEVTWENSMARNWLNSSFINSAFYGVEQEFISITTVTADKNPYHNTKQGNSTQDKMFLFSVNEVNKYFDSALERQCKATAYAKAQGANNSQGNCWWWLRTIGHNSNRASGIGNNGDIDEYGYTVEFDKNAIRPAMWLYIDHNVAVQDSNDLTNITDTTPSDTADEVGDSVIDTGYAAYNEKINEYIEAISLSSDEFNEHYDYGNDCSSINALILWYLHMYGGDMDISYVLYDVDGNKTPELLMSDGYNIIDIYTLYNGEIVKLFENCYFGDRGNVYVLSDGRIFCEGSSGAAASSCELYEFKSDGSGLDLIGAYYCDGLSGEYEEYDATYMLEEEYYAFVKQYDDIIFEDFDWIPVSEN